MASKYLIAETQLAIAHSYQPFVAWRTESEHRENCSASAFAVTLDDAQRFIVTRVSLCRPNGFRRRPSLQYSIIPLTFEIVKHLIELLLFSEKWKESISSHMHTALVANIKNKLHHLLLFWQRHNFHQGWLSEIF